MSDDPDGLFGVSQDVSGGASEEESGDGPAAGVADDDEVASVGVGGFQDPFADVFRLNRFVDHVPASGLQLFRAGLRGSQRLGAPPRAFFHDRAEDVFSKHFEFGRRRDDLDLFEV